MPTGQDATPAVAIQLATWKVGRIHWVCQERFLLLQPWLQTEPEPWHESEDHCGPGDLLNYITIYNLYNIPSSLGKTLGDLPTWDDYVRSCTLVKTWTLKHVETRRNTLKLQLQRDCNESNTRLALRWSSLAGASLSSWWPMVLAALEHGFNKYRRVAGERIKRVFQTCFSGVVTSKPQWFKWFRRFRVVQDCGSTDFAFISVLCDSIVDVYRSADPKPLKNAAFDSRVSVLVHWNQPCLTLSTLSRSCLEKGWKMTIVTKKDVSWWANSSEDLVGSPKFATCLDLFRFPWKYRNLAARCATVRSTGQLFWSTSWSPFYLSTFVAVGTETQGHQEQIWSKWFKERQKAQGTFSIIKSKNGNVGAQSWGFNGMLCKAEFWTW